MLKRINWNTYTKRNINQCNAVLGFVTNINWVAILEALKNVRLWTYYRPTVFSMCE
jgi:hypothetical protein